MEARDIPVRAHTHVLSIPSLHLLVFAVPQE
jgi:hypothetical protein